MIATQPGLAHGRLTALPRPAERNFADLVVPARLEAREPAEYRGVPRDHVQLLVSSRYGDTPEHAMFVDLASFLLPGDLLVVNDSATIPAALDATRTSGEAIALHLSTAVAGSLWIVEPRGPAHEGEVLHLPEGGEATLLTPALPNGRRLWFARLDVSEPVVEYLHAHGRAIRYAYVPHDVPIEAYQTMFARVPGSAEMPSAARPFTPRLVAELERHGVRFAALTLHCGVASSEAHEPPQPERYAVPARTAAAVRRAKREGRRVIAVGTTVVRALETAARHGAPIASEGWTDLVVTSGFELQAVDGVLTGLHEPVASHLEMLRAFMPSADLYRAYEAALDRGYLWHEFGDVHLIV